MYARSSSPQGECRTPQSGRSQGMTSPRGTLLVGASHATVPAGWPVTPTRQGFPLAKRTHRPCSGPGHTHRHGHQPWNGERRPDASSRMAPGRIPRGCPTGVLRVGQPGEMPTTHGCMATRRTPSRGGRPPCVAGHSLSSSHSLPTMSEGIGSHDGGTSGRHAITSLLVARPAGMIDAGVREPRLPRPASERTSPARSMVCTRTRPMCLSSRDVAPCSSPN